MDFVHEGGKADDLQSAACADSVAQVLRELSVRVWVAENAMEDALQAHSDALAATQARREHAERMEVRLAQLEMNE